MHVDDQFAMRFLTSGQGQVIVCTAFLLWSSGITHSQASESGDVAIVLQYMHRHGQHHL